MAKTYRVKWEIEVDAHTPRNAAIKALLTLLDLNNPENIATVFEVGDRKYDLQAIKDKIVAKKLKVKKSDL